MRSITLTAAAGGRASLLLRERLTLPGPRQAAETGPHLRLKACASAARGTIEAAKWRAAWNNLDDWGRDESVIQNDRQPLEYHWIF